MVRRDRGSEDEVEVLAVLRRALQILREKKWLQGREWELKRERYDLQYPLAVSILVVPPAGAITGCCLTGALRIARAELASENQDVPGMVYVLEAIRPSLARWYRLHRREIHLQPYALTVWNDLPGRTRGQVLQLLWMAVRRLERVAKSVD